MIRLYHYLIFKQRRQTSIFDLRRIVVPLYLLCVRYNIQKKGEKAVRDVHL
jgi:hypothetical protein